MKNTNLIKTPILNLAIGEPILLDDGKIGLRIKGKGSLYDTIPLDTIQKKAESFLKYRRDLI